MIIIGTVVVVIVLVGVTAVLAGLLHGPGTSTGSTPGVGTAAPTCSGAACTSTTTGNPLVKPTSLTASGAVSGAWTLTIPARCLQKQTSFGWEAVGLINGHHYGFIVDVSSARPGSYRPLDAYFTLSDRQSLFKDGTSDAWGSNPTGTLTITSAGGMTGTFDVVIHGTPGISNVEGTKGTPFPAPANAVHLTGSWTCGH